MDFGYLPSLEHICLDFLPLLTRPYSSSSPKKQFSGQVNYEDNGYTFINIPHGFKSKLRGHYKIESPGKKHAFP